MNAGFEWDDYRLFHALADCGSVRGTAEKLGISHSTLSRRLDKLEATLAVQLFERSRRGFKLTEAGELLRHSTLAAETSLLDGQRKVAGLDQRMSGPIRVSMPDILAYYVLLPAIGEFQKTYPEIELDIDISYVSSDLERRDADIAVRMLGIDVSPPESLFGRKIGQSYASAYATPQYLAEHDPAVENSTAHWLGWEMSTDAEWIAKSPYPHLQHRGQYNHAELQHHAARAGLGIAYIPCVLGVSDPDLVELQRMTPTPARDIWVLTHEDLRNAKRMKVFRDLMVETISAARPALSGCDTGHV